VDGTNYTATPGSYVVLTNSTDTNGQAAFNIGLPATIDAGDGISVKVRTENQTASPYVINNYTFTNTMGGITAPIVDPDLAATTSTEVEASEGDMYGAKLTFIDDPTWRANITKILVAGQELTNGNGFTTGSGYIKLNPIDAWSLHRSGEKYLTIQADNYQDVLLKQEFTAGVDLVTAETDASYPTTGDTITVKVKFSGSIAVTGSPKILLETGVTDRYADYTGLDIDETVMVFEYVVQDGDFTNDLNYSADCRIELNGGTIEDAITGVDVPLDLPPLNYEQSVGNMDITVGVLP